MENMQYLPLIYNRGFMRYCLKDAFPMLPYICLTGAQLKNIQRNDNTLSNQYFIFQKDNVLEEEKLSPETFSNKVFNDVERYIVTPCTKNATIVLEQFDLREKDDSVKDTELENKLKELGLQNGYIQRGNLIYLEENGIKYFLHICA